MRNALEEKYNATQQSNTKDILELKPKCNAMQHNSAMGRYVRNALGEQVQCNAMQQCNTKDIFKLKPKCNAMQHNTTVQQEDM